MSEIERIVRDGLAAAYETDGMDFDWDEIQRESAEADRAAWADYADHIWGRDFPEEDDERMKNK